MGPGEARTPPRGVSSVGSSRPAAVLGEGFLPVRGERIERLLAGAFAGDDGTLTVRWMIADEWLKLVWRETVTRPLPEGDRVGFGTTVLKTMVRQSLGAEVERLCHADDIEWRFAIPLGAIDPDLAPLPAEDAPTE